MGSSWGPESSGVICFKLSYESQSASIDWPVMGQAHTCILDASCLIFKLLLLILAA